MDLRIVIVGDGKVGFEIAKQLSENKHDVVIIDKDEDALKRANDKLDVMCVKGNGGSGTVLREAGAGSADVFIAATSSDEMNMVCCLTAKKLGAENTIARIRDYGYAKEIAVLQRELGIALIINPEQATASELARVLRFPSVVNLEIFVKGRVEMVGFSVDEDSPVTGHNLAQLRKKLPDSVLFAALVRGDDVYIPKGDTEFMPGDLAYVIGEPSGITTFFKTLGRFHMKVRDVVLIGGGRISQYLTHYIRKLGMKVKIIELDAQRCSELAEDLPDALIINADGTDQEVLESENISAADAVVTLTGRDEDNLMIALYSIQSGVPKVVAKSNRQNYNTICKTVGLETIVSPKNITANSIVHFVKGLENSKNHVMETLYQILGGRAQAIEFTIARKSEFLEKPLSKLRIRKDILIAVIVRGKKIVIPRGDDRFTLGDSVIVISKEQIIDRFEDIFYDLED